MKLFVLVSTIQFGFWAIVWNKENWPNRLISVVFWSMFFWGLVWTLKLYEMIR